MRTAISAANAYNAMVENFWLAASDDVKRFEGAREVILGSLTKLLDVTNEELTRVIGKPITK